MTDVTMGKTVGVLICTSFFCSVSCLLMRIDYDIMCVQLEGE